MHTYIAISHALDFAIKYAAVTVTLEIDDGELTCTPREAEEIFVCLMPGESFTLKSISWT